MIINNSTAVMRHPETPLFRSNERCEDMITCTTPLGPASRYDIVIRSSHGKWKGRKNQDGGWVLGKLNDAQKMGVMGHERPFLYQQETCMHVCGSRDQNTRGFSFFTFLSLFSFLALRTES